MIITPVVHQRRDDRSDGVGHDHLRFRRDLFEIAAEAGEGAPRPDPDDHGIEVVLHLLPKLGACGGLVRFRIGRVGELVDVDGVWDVGGDALSHVLVVVRVALADVRAGDPHIDAEAAQVLDFLPRHLVRHHQHQAIALEDAHLGETEAGVAGGGLDDGPAWLQPPVLLRRLNHGQGDPVLDRAAGVGVLELHEQAAGSDVELIQLQQRRMADQVEGGADSSKLKLDGGRHEGGIPGCG